MDFKRYSFVESKEQTELTQLSQHQSLHNSISKYEMQNSIPEDKQALKININLGDPMKSISDKYEYNYGLLLFFVLSLATVTFGNAALAFYSKFEKQNNIYRAITLIYFILLLLACIIVSIMARYQQTFSETFTHSLNRLITIKPPTIIYDIYQLQYAPLLFLISTLYCCILAILEQSYYYDISVSYEKKCVVDITESTCLIVGASFITTYQMCAAFAFFGLIQAVKCNEIIGNERSKIQEKYTITKTIADKIDNKLEEWKKSKQFKNRKFELSVVFCLFFSATFMVHAVIRVNIFSGSYYVGAVAYGIIIYIIDSLVITAIVGMLLTAIVHHYEFLSIIMDELSTPINANSIMELIGWWELRKYYIYCVINIHSSTLKYIIVGSLSGIVVFTSCYFAGPRLGLRDDILFIFLCSAICMIFIKFFIVSQAVSYHKYLLSHVNTINKERLQFDTNELIECCNNANHDNVQQDKMRELGHIVIDRIVTDIANNSHPISVLGVRMDAHFMLFLRASAITLGVAILIES